MHTECSSANNGASNVDFGSCSGGEDGEHNGVGLVEISSIPYFAE